MRNNERSLIIYYSWVYRNWNHSKPAWVASHLRFPTCFIRIDSATGFQTLDNDVSLNSYRITLDFGFVKNKNSNSVVGKAMQELELEFLKEKASVRAITNIQLQLAIPTLNKQNNI